MNAVLARRPRPDRALVQQCAVERGQQPHDRRRRRSVPEGLHRADVVRDPRGCIGRLCSDRRMWCLGARASAVGRLASAL